MTLVVLLGAFKLNAQLAAPIALVVAVTVALAIYGMPVDQTVLSAAEGAAFGLFPGSRGPFILISVLAIIVVLALFRREAYRGLAHRILLGCILGGAIGNLIDRARLGWVVDFIDVGVDTIRWPVFNVADSAVTLGVLFLAWNLSRAGHPAPDPESPHRPGLESR